MTKYFTKLQIHKLMRYALLLYSSFSFLFVHTQNLLLWNGEFFNPSICNTGIPYPYGGVDSTQAFQGNYCFEGTPDQWHAPGINMTCQGVWRANIEDYDELWFYAKATELGKTFTVAFYGWPHTSNGVEITPYIDGGLLDTVYRLVKLPLDLSLIHI